MSCNVCRFLVPCADCIGKVKRELCHSCDGPITDFVLISRAVRLSFQRKYSEEIISNALIEALQEYGFVKPMEESGTSVHSGWDELWAPS